MKIKTSPLLVEEGFFRGGSSTIYKGENVDIFLENTDLESASKVAVEIVRRRGFQIEVRHGINGDPVVLAAIGVLENELDVIVTARLPGVKRCVAGCDYYTKNMRDFKRAYDVFPWAFG